MKIITRISLGIVLSFCTHLLFAQSLSSDIQELSEAELAQMLAPIALYPDTVLAHVLIAATYPLEVVQAERWSNKNSDLSSEDALRAVEDEDWDPSVKALVPFPDLLKRMSDDLDWTQRLGDAFLLSEERVMASVQSLRQRAYDEGNLTSLENLDVSRDREVIIIEPSVREVVYIPYYDTRYVYGDWHWSRYPPVYWHSNYIGHRSHRVYWGPRVSVSFGFFFSSFQWHQHHVVVVDHHHHNRSNHSFYNGRHVARHQSARHWEHNPHHRRGVVYRNPRTRDYFESRKRSDANARQGYVPRQQFDEQRRKQVTRNIREPRKSDSRVRAKDRRDNSALIEQRKQNFEKRKSDTRKTTEKGKVKTDRNRESFNRVKSKERIKVNRNARQPEARQETQKRVEKKTRSQEPRMRIRQEQQERAQRQETKSRYKRNVQSTGNRQNSNRAVRTERKDRPASYRGKRER